MVFELSCSSRRRAVEAGYLFDFGMGEKGVQDVGTHVASGTGEEDVNVISGSLVGLLAI